MEDKNKQAYVAESAVVMGDVELGEDASIWPGVVLRGDSGKITVGARTNIQDNSVLHEETTVGKNCTIGHLCLVQACTVGDNVLIGMGSVIMDYAVLEDGCYIGAGSLVTERTVIPSGMLAFGRPAKVVRALTEAEKIQVQEHAQAYVDKAKKWLGKTE